MIRAVIAALIAMGVAGCAATPPPPDWQLAARSGLDAYSNAWLQGKDRVARSEFDRAVQAIRTTARADLLARAELTRCALQVASLEFGDCPGFDALRADVAAPERAYAAFLAARWRDAPAELLPESYRSVQAAGDAALAGIADPRARLIAAGVLLRAERITPAGISLAIETASAEGWRRPLLAWLTLQSRRARAAGDAAAVEAIERRIGRMAPPAR